MAIIKQLEEDDQRLATIIRSFKTAYPKPAEIARLAGIPSGQTFSDRIRILKNKIRILRLAREGRPVLTYVERSKINAILVRIPDAEMNLEALQKRGLGILSERMIGSKAEKPFPTFEVFLDFFGKSQN